MIGAYPVHLHKLPPIASWTSSRDGAGCSVQELGCRQHDSRRTEPTLERVHVDEELLELGEPFIV